LHRKQEIMKIDNICYNIIPYPLNF